MEYRAGHEPDPSADSEKLRQLTNAELTDRIFNTEEFIKNQYHYEQLGGFIPDGEQVSLGNYRDQSELFQDIFNTEHALGTAPGFARRIGLNIRLSKLNAKRADKPTDTSVLESSTTIYGNHRGDQITNETAAYWKLTMRKDELKVAETGLVIDGSVRYSYELYEYYLSENGAEASELTRMPNTDDGRYGAELTDEALHDKLLYLASKNKNHTV